MPYDPTGYGAAPRPGVSSADPYGAHHPDVTAPTGHDQPGQPEPGNARPTPDRPPLDESWHPVATAADHAHPGAAPGAGRYAQPWTWPWLRPRLGRLLHGLVRTGRWATGLTILLVVAATVLFTQIARWDTLVPLDGTTTRVQAAQGEDVWLWLPENSYAVDCRAWDAHDVELRPWRLLRNPVSDGYRALIAVPTGPDGAAHVSCEPGTPDWSRAPEPESYIRAGTAPASWQVQGYYALVRAGVFGFLGAAGITAVLWSAWGVLRATNVLPRLRPDGRRSRRARRRARRGS